MSKNNSLFPDDNWLELKKKLNNLRTVCFPSPNLIKPSIRFKRQSEFNYFDKLKRGPLEYSINPSELKYYWEDRRTLQDSCLDYIIVDHKKWFYNTNDLTGNFFLEDGSRKVEIVFPYWMSMSRIIKQPGVRGAIFGVLTQCMGSTFPTEEAAQSCFTDKLCRDIYQHNPSRAAIEMAVLEMVETLRQKIALYLNQNHSSDIAATIGFKRYIHSRIFPQNTPIEQQVREYLDGNKRALYSLGEKFHLIKNVKRLPLYEDMRDHVRHPDKVKKHILKPDQIYRDFCLLLNEPVNSVSRAQTFRRLQENIEIAYNLDILSQIWDILDQHVNPALKKKKNKAIYYTDLIQKGILKAEEADIIRSLRLSCNAVAHVNGFVKNARKKVRNDNKLSVLSYNLYDRHSQIIQRWLEENSRS